MKIIKFQMWQITLPEDLWLWLSIETDQGLIGWGEMTDGGYAQAMAQLVSELEPLFVDRDPRILSERLEVLRQWEFPNTYRDRMYASVQSAIDQALWDLYAQACDLPLYVLLGAFGTSEIPLYANLNRGLRYSPHLRTPAALEEKGRQAIDEGYAFVKCTPFDEMNPDKHGWYGETGLERIRCLNRSVPMEKIAVDFHQRFDLWSMQRTIPALLELGTPYWLEDPFYREGMEAWKTIRAGSPGIRWAGGEDSLCADDTWSLLSNGSIDVLMPDVKHAGGVSGMRTMIALAESRGIELSPHNPSSPISTAFSAHLAASCRSALPLEFPFGVTSERPWSVIPEEPVSGGTYNLSDRSGIGLKPNPDFLKKYGSRWSSGEWKTHLSEEE